MDGSADQAGTLLDRLSALPSGQRLEWLRAQVRAAGRAPGEALYELADRAEDLSVSQLSRALEVSDVVVALADELCGGRERARARRARAQCLSYAGRFDEALALLQDAVDIAERAGQEFEAARARMSSVHALASLGRFDAAIEAGERARAAFVRAGDRVLAARCDLNLGGVYQRRGDPEAAVRTFERARPYVADDPVILAKLDSNRGHALIGLDQFAAAERAYQAALATFEQRRMNWAAAIVEGNLAELATRQGRLERAFYHFERARRHLERDESPAEVARLLAEQADAQSIVGLWEEARASYEAALPALDAHGLAVEAARARAGLGRALLQLGRAADADARLRSAADGFARLGDAESVARVDLCRAELALEQGHAGPARELAQSALAVLADRPAGSAAARFHLARAATAAGDPQTALAELERAIEAAGRLDLAPLLADLHHLRGCIERGRGRRGEALASLRRAVECVERIRGSLQAERFRAGLLGTRLALYQDLVSALLDVDASALAPEALSVVERAKSRALLDLLAGGIEPGGGEAEDPAEADLADELARLRAELNVYYSRLADAALGRTSPLDVDRLAAEIHAREVRGQTLETRLASARGVAGLYSPPAQPADIAAALHADQALLEFFLAGQELIAFVVRDGTTRAFRGLATASDVAERVARVHFQIRRALRPDSDGSRRAARLVDDCRRELGALHAALIAPLGEALEGAARLVVVPHGPLHALPFAALWDGRAHLLERFELAAAPSASLLALDRSRPRDSDAGGGALVVGVPDELAPQIAHEARVVAQTIRAAEVITDAEATVARVRAALARARVAHLSCHGFFSATSPMASGLRLADRWLTAREVYALRLRARLLVLSACETGRSAVSHGDELIGLPRAFLAAGAGAVLVSLWNVPDASTAELMTSFYRHWGNNELGSGASTALRAAQRELLARRPHPAYWAPFVLVGAA